MILHICLLLTFVFKQVKYLYFILFFDLKLNENICLLMENLDISPEINLLILLLILNEDLQLYSPVNIVPFIERLITKLSSTSTLSYSEPFSFMVFTLFNLLNIIICCFCKYFLNLF